MVGIVNGFVHVVMYFYYFLCGIKPELKQSIWWKKHVTQMQLAQFTYLIIHFIRHLYEDCAFPQTFLWVLLAQNVFFFVLFGDFYRRVFMKKKIN